MAAQSTVEMAIRKIAHRQHGVAARAQLVAAEVTRHEISARLQRGTLIKVHPGVYRVGHRAPSVEATYTAAVLAGGNRALLCGRANAYLLGLIKGTPPAPEIICPTQRCIRGVRTHRARKTDPRDATTHRGIPVTTVPRTLADLAAVLSESELARACHEAEVRYRIEPGQVDEVLARRPNSPGAGTLRRVLRGEVRVLLSKLERRFIDLLRSANLELPQTNRPAGGRRVDCRWPKQRLTVELDSYRYHGSRHAWEADRRREREAFARGDAFRRYTWGDVFDHPATILRELESLIPSCPG